MKVTLTNNSCSRIRRAYPKFEVDVPGHKTVTVPVPDDCVDKLRSYLKTHHPAVVFAVAESEVAEEAQAPPVGVPADSSLAAIIADKSVLDINIDDQDPKPSETVEEHLRRIGLLTDPAPAVEVETVTAPAAPKKKTSGLIPAKKGVAKAKTTGGAK